MKIGLALGSGSARGWSHIDRGSDQFGTQGISASRENPFAQRMVRVGLAQESAADILGQIDRF